MTEQDHENTPNTADDGGPRGSSIAAPTTVSTSLRIANARTDPFDYNLVLLSSPNVPQRSSITPGTIPGPRRRTQTTNQAFLRPSGLSSSDLAPSPISAPFLTQLQQPNISRLSARDYRFPSQHLTQVYPYSINSSQLSRKADPYITGSTPSSARTICQSDYPYLDHNAHLSGNPYLASSRSLSGDGNSGQNDSFGNQSLVIGNIQRPDLPTAASPTTASPWKRAMLPPPLPNRQRPTNESSHTPATDAAKQPSAEAKSTPRLNTSAMTTQISTQLGVNDFVMDIEQFPTHISFPKHITKNSLSLFQTCEKDIVIPLTSIRATHLYQILSKRQTSVTTLYRVGLVSTAPEQSDMPPASLVVEARRLAKVDFFPGRTVRWGRDPRNKSSVVLIDGVFVLDTGAAYEIKYTIASGPHYERMLSHDPGCEWTVSCFGKEHFEKE